MANESNFFSNGPFAAGAIVPGAIISGTEPRLLFKETDQGADLKLWDIDVNGGVFSIRTRTDADGAGTTAWAVTRTPTTTISTQSWTAATSFTFNTGSILPGTNNSQFIGSASNGLWQAAFIGQINFAINSDAQITRGSAGTIWVGNSSNYDNVGGLGDSTHRLATIYARQFISSVNAVGVVGATSTIDVTLGQFVTITSTASTNMTLTPSAAGTIGQTIEFCITSDATGGDVVTFAAPFKSIGPMTLTASKKHTIVFKSDSVSLNEESRVTGL